MRRAAVFLVLAMLVVLAVASALLVRSRAERLEHSPYPRIDNGSARGLRAAYLYLVESRFPIEELKGPFTQIPATCKTILAAAPSIRPASRAEARKLVDWIEGGGLLVYLVPRIGEQRELARILGLYRQHTPPAFPAGGAFEPEADTVPWLPDPVLAGVHRLRMLDEDGIFSSFSGALPIAGAAEVATVSTVSDGTGRALIVAGPDPFQNVRLGKGDNLQFLANIASRGNLCIDEYHHEFPERSGTRTLGFLGPVVAQLLLCGAGVAISRGRRFGAARPLARTSHRSVNEYLTELGGVFGRAHLEGDVSRQMAHSLRQKLATRFGISVELEDEEADRRTARRTGIDEGRLLALLAQARAVGSSVSPQEFAILAREFAELENQLFA
jgi:hypothetical protein